MAFFSQGDVDLTSGDFDYETDAEPITYLSDFANANVKSNYSASAAECDPPIKDTQIEQSDVDAGPINCDRLVKDSAVFSDPGQFKFENSAVEISNSSSVRIGNSFNQKTDITFDRATSVIVDRRQWNYINCSDSKKVILL
jgi:hypothetical protein